MKLDLTVREKQKILLEMYEIIWDICEKKGLTLYATGGTVLGAIRHRGFIPWDDDMDFALPRYDFDMFERLVAKELPHNLKIRWMDRGRHYTVINIDYEIELNNEWSGLLEKGEKQYVFLDIHPLDGVANSWITSKLAAFGVMYRRAVYKMVEPDRIYKGARPLYEKILISLLKKNTSFRNVRIEADKYDAAMIKNSFQTNRYIADYCGRYHFKDVYPKSWWEPGVLMEFENTFVRCPIEYDKYLSRIYGDYKTIPNEKRREYHCISEYNRR